MTRIVAALFDSYDAVAQAVRRLEDAGVSHRDISIVSNHPNERQFVHLGSTDDAAAGAGAGAAVGAVLGGGAGLLAGLGVVAIPGLAPMVAAGWLAATLTGAAAGTAAGSLVGVLIGAGVSEEDAEVYTESVRGGGTLVIARVDDSMEEIARASLSGRAPADARPSHPLIESDRVEGTTVYDPNGKPIGSVRRLMIDRASGRVAYVVMAFGGLHGMGEVHQTIPWDALTYDTHLEGYRATITEEQVRGAPAVSADGTYERLDRERERALHDYYGCRYYWESLS